MSWATVDDGHFDPAHPDPNQYKSLVVPDMSEHGPLWRTSGDGLPLLRTNDTVNYPWHGELVELRMRRAIRLMLKLSVDRG